jgi:hypothetical protein
MLSNYIRKNLIDYLAAQNRFYNRKYNDIMCYKIHNKKINNKFNLLYHFNANYYFETKLQLKTELQYILNYSNKKRAMNKIRNTMFWLSND